MSLTSPSRVADPDRLMVPLGDEGAGGLGNILRAGNKPPMGANGEPDLGGATANQQAMAAMASFAGAPGGTA